MKFPRPSSVALAVLLAAFSTGAAAQGFSSVSSGKRLPDAVIPAPAPASTADVPAPVDVTPARDSAPPPFASQAVPAPATSGQGGADAAAPASGETSTGAIAPATTPSPGSQPAPEPPAVVSTEPNPFMSVPGGVRPAAAATTAPFGGSYANAVAASPRALEPAERLLVKKSERRLYLLRGDRVIAEYPIKLGLSPKGPKQREGDFRTPEGIYRIASRNTRSDFFLSLGVSYPNEADLERAKELGFRPGGLIMIHGQPNAPRKPPDWYASNDWTDGCIALSNSDMVDIWLRTSVGVPIEIRP